MKRALHHLAIRVHDLPRAEAFYGGLLELPVIARHKGDDGAERAIWFGLEDGFLALERCQGTPPAPSFRSEVPGLHLVALRIDRSEREALEERLRKAGHPRVAETGFTFYVLDPEGNRVGFSHHPEPRGS